MKKIIIGAALLALSNLSYSALTAVDLDGNAINGHEGVYDDVLDITWLANANPAVSLGFARGFVNSDGSMDWNEADVFMDYLNEYDGGAGYLGITNWRQPLATTCAGYDCSDSPTDTDDELAYQYYQNFGGSKPGGLFSNVGNSYWTNKKSIQSATYFITSTGLQRTDLRVNSHHVWPVAPGNVATNAVPLPATAWLFGSGLAGLSILRRKRKKL